MILITHIMKEQHLLIFELLVSWDDRGQVAVVIPVVIGNNS